MNYMLTSARNSVMSRHFIIVITLWWSEHKKCNDHVYMYIRETIKSAEQDGKTQLWTSLKYFPDAKEGSKRPKSLRKQNVTSLREILGCWELPRPVPNQLCTGSERSAPPSKGLGWGRRFKNPIYTRNEAADTPSVILYGTPEKTQQHFTPWFRLTERTSLTSEAVNKQSTIISYNGQPRASG